MFKKTVLALAAAATLAAAAVTVSAPAEAHIYPIIGHPPIVGHPGGYWPHHGYWGHPHLFVNGYVVGPVEDCYWVSRPIKIWTPGGPIWEHRNVQVCN